MQICKYPPHAFSTSTTSAAKGFYLVQSFKSNIIQNERGNNLFKCASKNKDQCAVGASNREQHFGGQVTDSVCEAVECFCLFSGYFNCAEVTDILVEIKMLRSQVHLACICE